MGEPGEAVQLGAQGGRHRGVEGRLAAQFHDPAAERETPAQNVLRAFQRRRGPARPARRRGPGSGPRSEKRHSAPRCMAAAAPGRGFGGGMSDQRGGETRIGRVAGVAHACGRSGGRCGLARGVSSEAGDIACIGGGSALKDGRSCDQQDWRPPPRIGGPCRVHAAIDLQFDGLSAVGDLACDDLDLWKAGCR